MRLFNKRVFFTKDQLSGEQFSIGEFTYGMPEIRNFDNKTKLSVGKYCSFGAHVSILLGGEHRTDLATTYPFPEIPEPWEETSGITGMTTSKGDISIGNDVWIGHGSIILSGATVGDGAVIGAGALICKDVPPYSIVGGNPAKLLRMRFEQETVQRLLKLAWWDWPAAKVRENVALICDANIEALLTRHDC